MLRSSLLTSINNREHATVEYAQQQIAVPSATSLSQIRLSTRCCMIKHMHIQAPLNIVMITVGVRPVPRCS